MAFNLASQRARSRWEPGTEDYQQITQELGAETMTVIVVGHSGSSRYVLQSDRQEIVRQ